MPIEQSATRPKLSASDLLSERTKETPRPKERINGTVIGPVVTPPESKAMLKKFLSENAARANRARYQTKSSFLRLVPVSILSIQTDMKSPTPQPTVMSKTVLLMCGTVVART